MVGAAAAKKLLLHPMSQPSQSLFQLLEHVRHVLALNFPESLYITAEIAQIKTSKGHHYLDLIEKDATDGGIVAQCSAVMWAGMYRRLSGQLGSTLDDVLREGLQVQLLVRVEYHERYGIKLIIEGVEPAYTLGMLAMQRRETLRLLTAQGLHLRNKLTALPTVVQRVAVISSQEAAGLQDFMQHLAENRFGYTFRVHLFPAAVQGKTAAADMSAQLEAIGQRRRDFDCVVIVRGGGARLDLQAFDDFGLCQAIAHCPLPVLCGIGHDVDEAIADMICHTSVKTPTAGAEFLVLHNATFETEVLALGQALGQLARQRLQTDRLQLAQWQQEIRLRSRHAVKMAAEGLHSFSRGVAQGIQVTLRQQHQQVEHLERLLTALRPERVLARGYSLTSHEGRIVRSADEVSGGDTLVTRLHDGTVESRVIA